MYIVLFLGINDKMIMQVDSSASEIIRNHQCGSTSRITVPMGPSASRSAWRRGYPQRRPMKHHWLQESKVSQNKRTKEQEEVDMDVIPDKKSRMGDQVSGRRRWSCSRMRCFRADINSKVFKIFIRVKQTLFCDEIILRLV